MIKNNLYKTTFNILLQKRKNQIFFFLHVLQFFH